ncbi:MAG TPA: alpha/beta hydrolase [Rhodoglobus sp.]|nr:alpha/beta hydrolase [Rhodoglobus sp.]
MSDAQQVPLIERIMRRVVAAIGVLVLLALLAALGVALWASNAMRGERAEAIEAWRNPAISIESTDHSIVMTPTEGANGSGLVFVPGARVDPYAYLYKLSGIVEQGVTVVITKPLLNLALIDTRGADVFTADAPEVERWLVGGHSMGGVRACLMAEGADVAGLVLLGAYCANDLSGTRLDVLSISGSEDGLTTADDIAANAHSLPSDADLVEIEGLNHALFGDYGPQEGDRPATIDTEEARTAITDVLRSVFVAVR